MTVRSEKKKEINPWDSWDMLTSSQFNLGCYMWDFRYSCQFSHPINNSNSWWVLNKLHLYPEFSGKVYVSIPSVFSTSPLQPWESIVCWEPTSPVFLIWNLQRLNVPGVSEHSWCRTRTISSISLWMQSPTYVKCNNSHAKCTAYQSASLIFPWRVNTGLFPEMTEEFTWVFGLGLCP